VGISNPPPSISFSGCGFLAVYQIGAVQCLQDWAAELLRSAPRVYGASGGSLTAAAVVCGENFDGLKREIHATAKEARKKLLGPFSPSFCLLGNLKKGLYRNLPENAHELATGRLFISMTRLSDQKNIMISEYKSKQEVVQALLCSCFVPVYSGMIPPTFRGERYVDGGLTNMQPEAESNQTITISPFTGETDICPRDASLSFYLYIFGNSSFQLSPENVARVKHALFPPTLVELNDFARQGYHDAILFLQHRKILGRNVPAVKLPLPVDNLCCKDDLCCQNAQDPIDENVLSHAADVYLTWRFEQELNQKVLYYICSEEKEPLDFLSDLLPRHLISSLLPQAFSVGMAYSIGHRIMEWLWEIPDVIFWVVKQTQRI
uniref:triacylglycerol lipase n=1 Tax=Latimeria chalumnae TaxID=7897 RepID=H3A9F7_LATCH